MPKKRLILYLYTDGVRKSKPLSHFNAPGDAYEYASDWLFSRGSEGDRIEIIEEPGEYLWFNLQRGSDGIYDITMGENIRV